MLFYKVSAILEDEKWAEGNNDRRTRLECARRIAKKSDEFNQKSGNRSYCFVCDIEETEVTCGILSDEPCKAEKEIGAFFRALDLKGGNVKSDEITLSTLTSLLSSACRNDYIEDDDEVMEQFGLDRIKRGYSRGIEFGENLLHEYTDKAALYQTADRLLTNETLRPELDRICSGKMIASVSGHPVHYVVQTDDRETRKTLCRTLLQALYANGRLKSRRYCFVDFKPGESFSRTVYDSLYKSCAGGAILVRYEEEDDSGEESDRSSGGAETVSLLCETMKKYRNSVLTVFCFPRACERTKKMFFEELGSVSVVEIREDLADAERSAGYLKMLCREQRIRPDKALLGRIEPEKLYLPDELRETFTEWYHLKMKTAVYPQYKEVAACRKEAAKDKDRGNAYEKLRDMIGLREAKEVIEKALNYYRVQKLYKDKGLKQDRPAMHMIFTGNPGTAKTTAARLFARIMKENGLLSKGHLVEVGRGDLVGKYVGWTAPIVKQKFKEAAGGVLFIDEAYSLVDGRDGMYGDEAINTIVQEMENRREDLVVIFAGYPDKMEGFLRKNPGLRSRIAFHVPFSDYGTEELCLIAQKMGKESGVTFTDAALEKLSLLFEIARREQDFGNGRYVRNVLEQARMNLASRVISVDPDEVTAQTLTRIEAADIELPAEKNAPVRRAIGFVS